MKVKLTDLTIQIAGTDDELKKLYKFETYDDNSLCYSRGGYDPRKSKKVPLLKPIKGFLVGYAGLAKEIFLFAKKNNISIEEFIDAREHFDFQKKEYSHDDLRKLFNPKFKYVEHQINIIRTMLSHNKAIICAPTSAGKSSVMSAFMRLSNLPTLVITDRSTLGAQLAEGFRKDGIDCGFCAGSGVRKGYCMVSTIQSVKKIQDISRFKCVIADECHRDSSKTFQEFLASFGCPLKYGFSASPSNGNLLDFARIRQHLGSIEIQIQAEELIENEVMARPEIFMVKTTCPDTFDYPSANDLGIVHNDIRNKQIKEIAEKYIAEEGYVCILVKNIEHGELLEEMIPDSVFLRGENKLKDRTQVIKDFDEGKIKCLIASSILNEGISISNMRTLILAGAGKAYTQAVQKVGRVLRITSNKKKGRLFDFIDSGNKWLLRHSKQRLSIYKQQGYKDITIVENLEEINEPKNDN